MKEIIIGFKQVPDGTYTKELSIERDVPAVVAINMLKHTLTEINTALNEKAVAAGHKNWNSAPKDWIFEQMCDDVLERK